MGSISPVLSQVTPPPEEPGNDQQTVQLPTNPEQLHRQNADPALTPTTCYLRSVSAESSVSRSGRSSTASVPLAGMLAETPSSSSSSLEHILLRIGEGWCGIVYDYTKTGAVLKKEKRGITTLQNDFNMQSRVWQSFGEAHILFGSSALPRTTRPFFYVEVNSKFWQKWWKDNLSKFPEVDQESPANILLTERIPPIPLENQEDLIGTFCPATIRDSAKDAPENKNCIVRLYLGRRKRGNNISRFFSLKNFPLHLDMAEEWGIDVKVCASQMAVGLAICQWRAQVDANDVEFVLGGFPTPVNFDVLLSALPSEQSAAFSETQQKTRGGSPDNEHELRVEAALSSETQQEAHAEAAASSETHQNEYARTPPTKKIPKPMKLWMLDYDKCRRMSYTEDGIRQAARAAEDNDPYFPKPLQDSPEDQELWEHFKSSYLDASAKVLTPQGLHLELGGAPRLFLEEWEIYRHQKIKSWRERDF